jgi:uncharacterized protein (TIGR03435 family)
VRRVGFVVGLAPRQGTQSIQNRYLKSGLQVLERSWVVAGLSKASVLIRRYPFYPCRLCLDRSSCYPVHVIPAREFLAVLGAVLLVGPVSTGAQAQARDQHPAFEVASVRTHDPNDRTDTDNFQPYPGGGFTATNCSLWMLIHFAFQIQPYQIPDKPGWIRSEHFDLDAKPGEAHPFDDVPLMLQGLLADRFHLKYHWETKESPVYELVVVKPGKLPRSIVSGDCPSEGSKPTGIPDDASCGGFRNSPGEIKGYNLATSEMASGLTWFLDRPVVDKTNLLGKYDVALRWTPESVAASDHDTPTIFTAIQEQLGLKLQPAKGPVRMFVIDHIEKPSDN